MGGLFGGKKTKTSDTRAMGIDFQGAQYGNVIPVGYGRAKVAGNVIWYGDYASVAHTTSQGGKGGGSNTNTTYTYSASFQVGLGEGVAVGVPNILNGSATVSPSSLSAVIATGTAGQAAWGHLTGTAALGYSGTTIISFPNLNLGSSPNAPNYNYEVDWPLQYGGGIVDANPKDVLNDICTSTTHGVPFNYLGSLTQYSNYCIANGLFLSPVYDTQQDATQILTDLMKYTNSMAYYSDDQLKVVPLGDVAVTGNSVTYTPANTPVVALGQADLMPLGSPVITVDRKAPQDCMNLVRVDYNDRTYSYHTMSVAASIDQDVNTNGMRSDTSESVPMCKTAAVARLIAQNLVQRAYYVRNVYTFQLGWRYCYLEPTDIVTLTDVTLGLNAYPVRILGWEEDADGLLTFTAEEFPVGIGHTPAYGTQANNSTSINPNVDPGAVNAPYLFRGPGFLVDNNFPEIWCAVCGSGAWWAAADVYLSRDNVSYSKIGTVAAPARYGSLVGSFASHADPDTSNTAQVNVYAPAQLLGGTTADRDNFNTLCMIDTEVLAYQTSGFVSAGVYNLSSWRRGGYGSSTATHTNGAPFVRLDEAIFKIPLDPSTIGQTIYVKFLSINSFGNTPRTLAGETAYSYVIGSNVELPDVPATPTSFAVLPVADGINLTWSNPNPAAVGCTSIERSTSSGGTYTVIAQVGPTATSFHDSFTSNTTYYYKIRARGPLISSGWSAYTSIINSTGLNVSALIVPGSTQQIASQLNMPPIGVGNAQAQVPTVISYTSAAGTPATATISVAAWTMTAGSFTVAYSAMSVGTTGTNGTNITYYLYFDDANYAGGSRTLVATTTGTDVYASNARIYVGQVIVSYPSSGAGGGAAGGGGACVTPDMLLFQNSYADDLEAGVWIDCMNYPKHGTRKFQRPVLGAGSSEEPCVRIVTDKGAELTCSIHTPFDLLEGGSERAPNMKGKRVITDHGIERVITVEDIGVRRVIHVHVGGVSFAAGRNPRHRIYSHNLKP